MCAEWGFHGICNQQYIYIQYVLNGVRIRPMYGNFDRENDDKIKTDYYY
jgi:hypothetical protein